MLKNAAMITGSYLHKPEQWGFDQMLQHLKGGESLLQSLPMTRGVLFQLKGKVCSTVSRQLKIL